jgi:hypothetical protein
MLIGIDFFTWVNAVSRREKRILAFPLFSTGPAQGYGRVGQASYWAKYPVRQVNPKTEVLGVTPDTPSRTGVLGVSVCHIFSIFFSEKMGKNKSKAPESEPGQKPCLTRQKASSQQSAPLASADFVIANIFCKLVCNCLQKLFRTLPAMLVMHPLLFPSVSW